MNTKNTSDNTVMTKKENPWREFLFIMSVSIMIVTLALFVAGFVLGMMGKRPPTIDPDAVMKNTPTAVYTPEAKHSERDEHAYQEGKEAGENFKNFKGKEDSYWAGFNEGSKENKR